ncbi:MAG: UDP-N-acetylmuramoyl-L-alanine--D-glutamate ligase [Candidatus Comchoanobacterales bacterium]
MSVFSLEHLKEQHHVWVLGLGKTGLALARFCLNHHIDVSVIDDRSEPPGLDGWQALSQQPVLKDLSGIPEGAVVLISSSFSPLHPWMSILAEKKVIIGTELAIFSALNAKPVIAVTGTNGKTTTCHIIGDILRQSGYHAIVAGNSGYPLLDALQDHPDVWVLELSSYQCYWLKATLATVAVILNIEPDHLEWHGGFDAYKSAKDNLLKHSQAALMRSSDLSFSYLQSTYTFDDQEQAVFKNHLRLTGWDGALWHHDQINALAAVALVDMLGIKLLTHLMTDQWTLPHRCQVWQSPSGRWWVNDSKATNVAACMVALSQFLQYDRPIFWLVGGVFKEEVFDWPFDVLPDQIWCYGQDKKRVAHLLDVPQIRMQDTLQTTLESLSHLPNNAIILLSPACASFDEFSNFEARGHYFLAFARQYENTKY